MSNWGTLSGNSSGEVFIATVGATFVIASVIAVLCWQFGGNFGLTLPDPGDSPWPDGSYVILIMIVCIMELAGSGSA